MRKDELEEELNIATKKQTLQILKDIRKNRELVKEVENGDLRELVIEKLVGSYTERLKEQKLYDFFDILFKELCENEGKALVDIELLGSGIYSTVYGIGDKVIKIGDTRNNEKIPYHPRILQPIVRQQLRRLKNSKEGIEESIYPFLFVEVTERVQKIEVDKLSKEEKKHWEEVLYSVWKELRENGIMWGDPKIENLGILLKSNKAYRKSKIDRPIKEQNGNVIQEDTEYVSDEAVGFAENISHKILGAGEVVVLDTDWLQTIDSTEPIRKMAQYFEQIYRHEKMKQEEEKESRER